MGLCTRGSGAMTRPMAGADSFTPMGMSTKESGSMIKLKEWGYTLTWMVHNTRVNGKKINNMVRVKSRGQTGQCTKVTTSWGRNTAMENSCGLMAPFT